MSLEAGKLRHRVRLESFGVPLDSNGDPQRGDYGEPVNEWGLVAEIWAAIEPLSAREFIQSATTQTQITTRIVIRYRAGVTSITMRIVHEESDKTTIYNILGVLADKDSGREYLTLPCAQGVGAGV